MSEHQKLQEALDACARMQDQRDQLAAQLKDATYQCGVMAELLRKAEPLLQSHASYLHGEGHWGEADDIRTTCLYIEDALVNKLSAPAVPEGWRLVPVEPTTEMMLHNSSCQHHAPDDMTCPMRRTRSTIWGHMLAAAPKPEDR